MKRGARASYLAKKATGGLIKQIKRLLAYKVITYGVIFVIIIGLVGLFTLVRHGNTETSARKFYYTQINDLYGQIVTLSSDANGENFSDINEFKNYDKQMSDLIKPCNKIIRYHTSQPKTLSSNLKDLTDKLSKLCQDVITVASYQQNLYAQLQLLVTYQTPLLLDYTSPDFPSRLDTLNSVLLGAQNGIKKLDSSKVGDGGLIEMQNELTALQKHSQNLDVAAIPSNPTNLNSFVKAIGQVQTDLLVRRSYYWNNTIEQAKLKEAVRRQIDYYR